MSAGWDRRFMLLAHHLAEWSKESGRRVGTVVAGPANDIRSTGYNGFARGVNDAVAARHSRETGAKYFWSCHAEQNAIFNAARTGVPLEGCRIYVPWFPCVECAKAIIQAGIVELVAYEPDFAEPRWGEQFRLVVEMLNEGGVRVRFMERLMELPTG